jgi:hypothetical protein
MKEFFGGLWRESRGLFYAVWRASVFENSTAFTNVENSSGWLRLLVRGIPRRGFCHDL